MLIAVIDAQGAGIGKTIITELRREFPVGLKIYALGTNEIACANMKSAGANELCAAMKKLSATSERAQ